MYMPFRRPSRLKIRTLEVLISMLLYPKEMLGCIIGAIRRTVADNPKWFTGGAIGVMLVPVSAEAIAFYAGKDSNSFKHVCPIFEGASTYVVDEGEQLDCTEIVAQKIAACAAAGEMGLPMLSGFYDLGEKYPQPEYAPWKGGIGIKVYLDDSLQWTVFVAVSGSEQQYDLLCAQNSIAVINTFFGNCYKEGEVRIVDPFAEISYDE